MNRLEKNQYLKLVLDYIVPKKMTPWNFLYHILHQSHCKYIWFHVADIIVGLSDLLNVNSLFWPLYNFTDGNKIVLSAPNAIFHTL